MNRLQLGGQSIPGNLPTWGGAAALVLLALGFGLGYLLLDSQETLLPETTAAAASLEPARPTALIVEEESVAVIPLVEADDLLHHLEAATESALKATEQLKRSEESVIAVLPGLDRYYLSVEKKRLESAKTFADSARQHMEAAREQINVVTNLVRERSHQ